MRRVISVIFSTWASGARVTMTDSQTADVLEQPIDIGDVFTWDEFPGTKIEIADMYIDEDGEVQVNILPEHGSEQRTITKNDIVQAVAENRLRYEFNRCERKMK